MNAYIDKLFAEHTKKTGVKQHVIQVPISNIRALKMYIN